MHYAARTLNLGNLGYLPPVPPPQVGYDWVRVMVEGSSTQQRRACSGVPDCQIINGFAWRRIPKATAEFQEQTPQQFCGGFYQQWANDNPDKVRCLRSGDRDTLIGWCVQAVNGSITQAQAVQNIDALVSQRCTETHTIQCNNELQAWAQRTPGASCLDSDDARQMLGWCMQVKSGVMTPQAMSTGVDQLVAARCQAEPEIPASPPTPPPPEAAPPQPAPAPTVPAEPVEMIPPDAVAVTPTVAPIPTEKPSALRQWGPIVGLGLLAAVVLTAMRR